MLAEMTLEETKAHNTEHCKSIAEGLDAIACGTLYRCPECGEEIDLSTLAYPEHVTNGDAPCPHCGEEVDEFEQLSVYDWLADALDWEYVTDSRKQYMAARVLVAFGGPSIYVDTMREAVELFWWTDQASYHLTRQACEELDEAMQQLFEEF